MTKSNFQNEHLHCDSGNTIPAFLINEQTQLDTNDCVCPQIPLLFLSMHISAVTK